MAMKERMKSIIGKMRLANVLHFVAVPALTALLMIIIVDICGRLFFGRGILVARTLAGLLALTTAYSCAGISWREGEFVGIDLLSRRFKGRPRLIVDLFGLAVGLLCVGLLLWLNAEEFVLAIGAGSKPFMINMPLWPWKLVIPLGSLALGIEMIRRFVEMIGQFFHKKE